MKELPHVSVIVPVKDDAFRLGLCLEALAAQTYEGDFEVVVGDNGSSDDPESVVKKYSFARLVSEPENGSYAARNAAVKDSRGEVLAFTDADCIPSPDWIKNGVARLQKEGNAFVGGRVRLFPLDPNRVTAGEAFNLRHGFPQQRSVEVEKWSVTANMLTSRAIFDFVGPFQQTFISSGDREWGNRAFNKGVKALYCEEVEVAHPCRRDLSEHRNRALRFFKGDVQLRRLQDRPLITVSELFRSIAPPLPTFFRSIGKVTPPNFKTRLAYTWALLYLNYARLWDRLVLLRTIRNQKEL